MATVWCSFWEHTGHKNIQKYNNKCRVACIKDVSALGINYNKEHSQQSQQQQQERWRQQKHITRKNLFVCYTLKQSSVVSIFWTTSRSGYIKSLQQIFVYFQFEEHWWRNKEFNAFLLPKTSKIVGFLIFDSSWPKKIWFFRYMLLGNTRNFALFLKKTGR